MRAEALLGLAVVAVLLLRPEQLAAMLHSLWRWGALAGGVRDRVLRGLEAALRDGVPRP